MLTDIVSVGIGGSDLGPRLIVDALARPGARFRVHFISNVDGNAARRVLAGLDPAKTAGVVISKTFGTRRPCSMAALCGSGWATMTACSRGQHECATVVDFGIPPERTLPMWTG